MLPGCTLEPTNWCHGVRGLSRTYAGPLCLACYACNAPTSRGHRCVGLLCPARNVFICDFIGALERCHRQMFRLYKNVDTQFKKNDFHSFNMLLQLNHKSIPMKWDTNLNLPKEQLTFVFGD